MKRVLTAVVLVPLVLLVVFLAPLWLFTAVIGVILIASLREYLGIVDRYEIKPIRWVVYAIAILMIAWMFSQISVRSYSHPRNYALHMWVQETVYWAILLLAPVIFGIPVVFRRDLKMALAGSSVSVFGILYIAVPLTLLIAMRFEGPLQILLIFILLTVWAGDVAAYYVGRTTGRHKLAPVVSPNKTWEGAIASVAGSVLIAWVVFHYWVRIDALFSEARASGYASQPYAYRDIAWKHVFILAVLTNIAAQFGDLFESAIKRGAQVKDSGTLLPGHGGILDRIDALLFAIPTAWYYAALTRFLEKYT